MGREEVGEIPDNELLGMWWLLLDSLHGSLSAFLKLSLSLLPAIALHVWLHKADCRYIYCQGNRLDFQEDKVDLKLSQYKMDKK